MLNTNILRNVLTSGQPIVLYGSPLRSLPPRPAFGVAHVAKILCYLDAGTTELTDMAASLRDGGLLFDDAPHVCGGFYVANLGAGVATDVSLVDFYVQMQVRGFVWRDYFCSLRSVVVCGGRWSSPSCHPCT